MVVQSGPSRMSSNNEGTNISSNVKVAVRIRPQNHHEQESNHRTVVRELDEHVLVFDPKEESSPGFFHGKRRKGRDLTKRKNKDIQYAFDFVFDCETTNKHVYELTTKSIVDTVLNGYNCSVFAYGATGAGKTFTMLGSRESPGVVFYTMMDLYERLDELKEEKTCDVAVSYLEVYNEQIRDLLIPGAYLPIREDNQKGVIVAGLSLHKPRTAEELLHMLEFGNKNRTQHPTDANAESSRSHAVFQVFVRQKSRTAGLSADFQVAKMSLIDLAGSERATVTKNRGARFREGANINRSLLALGNCINALADGKNKGHVPYRNSKLTRLLKDSLGGNCHTVMIAAISPSGASYEDTHNTLKYANRAKNIKSNLKKNIMSVDLHVHRYAQIVEQLQNEILELKEKLRLSEEKLALPAAQSVGLPLSKDAERLQESVFKLFAERTSIKKELMELESTERDNMFKIHRKQKCLQRINLLVVDPDLAYKLKKKTEGKIDRFKKKLSMVVKRKMPVLSRMHENEEALKTKTGDVSSVGSQSQSNLLQAQLKSLQLEVELHDTKRQVNFLKKLCRNQHVEAQQSDKLLCTVLSAYRKSYLLLRGHKLATQDMQEEFNLIENMVEGNQEVCWEDQTINEGKENIDANSSPQCPNKSFNVNLLLSFPGVSGISPVKKRRSPAPKTPTARPSKHDNESTCSNVNDLKSPLPKIQDTPADESSQHHTSRFKPTASHRPTPNHKQFSTSEQSPILTVSTSSPVHPKSDCVLSTISRESYKSCHSHSNTRRISDCNSMMDVTVTVPASQSILLSRCHSNSVLSSQLSVISPRTGKEYNTENGEDHSYGAKREPVSLNETFEMEGVKPLEPSPKSENNCHKSVVVTNRLPSVDSSPHCVNESNASVSVNKSSCEREHYGKLSSAAKGSSTVTKALPTTHVKPPVICNTKENQRPSAKRSMDFNTEQFPSPAGKLTFAEVLKSPAVSQIISQQPRLPFSPRSPLASRENLPSNIFPDNSHLQGPIRRVTYAAKDSNKFHHHPYRATSHTPPSKSTKNNEVVSALKRLGIESVRTGQSASNSLPSYMHMTTAAARRAQKKSIQRLASFDDGERNKGPHHHSNRQFSRKTSASDRGNMRRGFVF